MSSIRRTLLPLAAVAALASPLSAERATPQKVVKVKYMSSRLWQGDEPGGYSKITEAIYSPDGKRVEYADGDVHIENKRKKQDVWLRTERQVAEIQEIPTNQPDTPEDAKLTRQFKALGKQMFKSPPKIATRNSTLRGYSCKVTVSDVTFLNVRVRNESWEAKIGGHPVVLRSVYQAYKNGKLADMTMGETVEIQMLRKTPEGCLSIPEDYEVVKVKWNDIRKALSKGMEELKKSREKP